MRKRDLFTGKKLMYAALRAGRQAVKHRLAASEVSAGFHVAKDGNTYQVTVKATRVNPDGTPMQGKWGGS